MANVSQSESRYFETLKGNAEKGNAEKANAREMILSSNYQVI